MTAIDSFKVRLEEMREDIVGRLKRIDQHIHHRAPVESPTDHQNDDVVLALDETLALELEQVKNALKRIELGNFGICRQCHGEIEHKRLQAIPYVEICTSCAGLA